jgi:urease accessory protein
MSGPPSFLLPLLYLASPALPTGAFAWSQGLAPACANGLVQDAPSLRAWWGDILHFGLECLDLPVLFRCFQAAGKEDAPVFFHWNDAIFAGRESAELWREEEQTGKALCRLLRVQGLCPDWMRDRECGYVAAFALAAVRLGCPAEAVQETACAYVWSWLENQAAIACKCLSLGQNEVQSIVLDLMPRVSETVVRAARIPDEAVGSCLPGLAIASSGHERQYSRMFRS